MDVTFLLGALALISALTTLATEGVKKLLDEAGKSYAPNLLAAILSVVITIGASIGYMIIKDIPFDPKSIVEVIGLLFLSFLCSTVGFDKVKQTLAQLGDTKTSGK